MRAGGDRNPVTFLDLGGVVNQDLGIFLEAGVRQDRLLLGEYVKIGAIISSGDQLYISLGSKGLVRLTPVKIKSWCILFGNILRFTYSKNTHYETSPSKFTQWRDPGRGCTQTPGSARYSTGQDSRLPRFCRNRTHAGRFCQ